jgi:hypothetical protein
MSLKEQVAHGGMAVNPLWQVQTSNNLKYLMFNYMFPKMNSRFPITHLVNIEKVP